MRIVIFGLGRMSALAWHSIVHDSPHEVAGFTVDRNYLHTDTLYDLPVVAFEDIERRFPPSDYAMLTPLGGIDMNRLRIAKYTQGVEKGYRSATYISSRAMTWPDLLIGENSMIYEGAIVQPFASIGRNTILRSGCHVSHHAVVGDHCFVAAHACLAGGVVIKERCFIGVNATIQHNVTIAPGTLVAAGATITADTTEDGIYVGVPTRRALKRADSATP